MHVCRKLEIPAYELNLPVISQWSYPKLRMAPCRYEGSAYLDNLIISAHNYNSHFGNLKNLQMGDLIVFTDMDGNVFEYRVAERETLMPTAIEEMKSGDWDLTLFTCTLGGQYRVTVRCERIKE
ncbi:MAG: sortase [Lachnospiraceae bacterium]|nr:sortase [Lachnospiraceae bacterium]